MNTVEVGRIGENAAQKYLESLGYKILEKNHRTRWSEIDIIATKKDRLYFVEVRAKNGEQFGAPEETINYKKISRMIKAAYRYLVSEKYRYKKFQIDAVCVVLNDNEVSRISHYENITF